MNYLFKELWLECDDADLLSLIDIFAWFIKRLELWIVRGKPYLLINEVLSITLFSESSNICSFALIIISAISLLLYIKMFWITWSCQFY